MAVVAASRQSGRLRLRRNRGQSALAPLARTWAAARFWAAIHSCPIPVNEGGGQQQAKISSIKLPSFTYRDVLHSSKT